MAKLIGATATPRTYPRPDYGPALPVFAKGIWRTIQLPLLYTCLAKLLSPVYAAVHAAVLRSSATAAILRAVVSFAPWVVADDVFFMVGLSIAVGASYIFGNGFFAILDNFSLLQHYHLPRTRAQAPPASLVRRALRKEALSHCVTGPLIMLFAAGPGLRAVGSPVAISLLPPWATAWSQLAVQLVINETMFYFGHRLLHTEPLYLAIHKQVRCRLLPRRGNCSRARPVLLTSPCPLRRHRLSCAQHHSFIGTRSFAGEYAHVLEDVLTAYIPFLTGLFITRAHFHLVFVWFFIRVIGVAEGHSGYCFKNTIFDRIGLANASAAASHDFHHTRNRCEMPQSCSPYRKRPSYAPRFSELMRHLRSGNFGHPMYDWLFGTMDVYLAAGGEAAYIEMGCKANAVTRGPAPSVRSSLRVAARQHAKRSM